MNRQEKLDELKKRALADNNLPLKEGATNLVFGVGNPDADILFIGEGPGYWEDIKAEPFVGNAGALLNRLLVLINLPREKVYITNVIMYRPPGNRDPEPDEIKAFSPYLDGIINTVEPKIICTLGRFSMAKFLPGVLISNVHGREKVVSWQGRQLLVVPMYHPAAALRSGQIKERLTADFEKLPKLLREAEKVIEEEKNSSSETSKNGKIKQMKLV